MLSMDPCRVETMPSILNERTGLVALLIGSRRDLEWRSSYSVVEAAGAMRFLSPQFQGHAEGLGPMKHTARRLDRKSWVPVNNASLTAMAVGAIHYSSVRPSVLYSLSRPRLTATRAMRS